MSTERPWWINSDPNFKAPEVTTQPETPPTWASALHDRLASMEAKMEAFIQAHMPAKEPEPLPMLPAPMPTDAEQPHVEQDPNVQGVG